VISAPDGLPPLREVIRRHGLIAKKSLGQNFLLDLNLAARIARAAGALAGITVVEIGSGPGGLTRALLALDADRVIAVERDERAIAALHEIAERYPGRLDVVPADALTFDPRSRLDHRPARIVANLPYNIATALLVSWACVEPWPPWYDAAILMFQREVAERIRARAGERAYSGEGLVGLSWAFLRAGAHHVVAALWEATDASTERLMDKFYDELDKGARPDAALRAAKLSLLRGSGFHNPFYWAPFQLYAGS